MSKDEKNKTVDHISFFFILMIASCAYHNEEELYPVSDNSCDTTNVSYSLAILPILQSSCYSCHSNANAPAQAGGLKLEGYDNFKVWVVNGRVEGAINHLPGYSPMPQGRSMLDECSINKIEAWINQGAKNN